MTPTRPPALAGPLLCLAALCLAGGFVAADSPSLEAADLLAPLPAHARTSVGIVDRLRNLHLEKSKPLDDEASEEIFDAYLRLLDSKRVFFLAEDVAEFDQYRHALDDALREGELEAPFAIYNVFRERALQRVAFETALLEDGLERFDFSRDEAVALDRSEAPWAASHDELEALWRLALKGRVLGGKLAGDSLEEIGDTLAKRAKNSRRLIRQTRSEDVFGLFMNAFTRTYDKHTQYFSPRDSADFNIHMSLSLEGIGAVLGTSDEYTVVHRLVKGGPADLGGSLKPNERIVAVSQSVREPFVDIVGWRTDEVVELIRGPKGSPVRLKVMPAGPDVAETRVVEIVRDVVKLEEQAASKSVLKLEGGTRPYRIGVVVVPTFYMDFEALRAGDPDYKSTTRDVARLIAELKAEDMDGLIVDLRNNGGGSLQEAVELAGLFVESGPVVQVSNPRRRPDVFRDTDDLAAWRGPLAVMVNGFSASASEIFAGAIQDYGLGIVVGSETFGKGTVQSLVPLQRGELKLTERRFYRVSGEGTEQNGVEPDILFPLLDGHLDDAPPAIGAIDTPGASAPPTDYPAVNEVAPLLDVLRARHAERAQEHPEFVYLRRRAERIEEMRNREELSLREDVRRAQKEADDAWLLATENARLVARGEEPVATVDELADRREQEALAEAETEDDVLVRETAHILVDFISLSRLESADASLSVRPRGVPRQGGVVQ